MTWLKPKPLRTLGVGLCLSLMLETPAMAAPGDLDTTFSLDGKVTTNFTRGYDEAVAIAIQPDGKILVGGLAGGTGGKFALARYNVGGDLDTTFGGGKVTTDFGRGTDWINALAVQSDGKIVAVGGDRPARGDNVRIALARYNTDGSLDTSFSGDGKATTNFTSGYDYAEDVILQSDGKIVVVGGAGGAGGRFALARYIPSGALDLSFGGDGKVVTNFASGFDAAVAVAIQPDSKIVAGGWSGPSRSNDYRFAAARYNTDGSLDPAFGGDGKVTTNFTTGNDYAWDMALQSDGEIVLAGAAAGAGERFALARYDATGALDDGFGGDGKVITNFNTGSDVATGVAVHGDGRIVAAGWSGPARSSDYRFALARYDSDGGLDSTFGGDGKVTTNFTSGNDYAWDMGLQTDGKIVAVGHARGSGGRFAVARYLMD
jgi:uncharacterized delta-60 repeat protein